MVLGTVFLELCLREKRYLVYVVRVALSGSVRSVAVLSEMFEKSEAGVEFPLTAFALGGAHPHA